MEILELFLTFAKIGSMMFGGGMAMLPLLQRELVDNKKWVTEEEILEEAGYVPANVDITIVAQRPKLAPYIGEMRQNVDRALRIPVDYVSVKATSTEKMGYEGRGEGISAQAAAIIAGTVRNLL